MTVQRGSPPPSSREAAPIHQRRRRLRDPTPRRWTGCLVDHFNDLTLTPGDSFLVRACPAADSGLVFEPPVAGEGTGSLLDPAFPLLRLALIDAPSPPSRSPFCPARPPGNPGRGRLARAVVHASISRTAGTVADARRGEHGRGPGQIRPGPHLPPQESLGQPERRAVNGDAGGMAVQHNRTEIRKARPVASGLRRRRTQRSSGQPPRAIQRTQQTRCCPGHIDLSWVAGESATFTGLRHRGPGRRDHCSAPAGTVRNPVPLDRTGIWVLA